MLVACVHSATAPVTPSPAPREHSERVVLPHYRQSVQILFRTPPPPPPPPPLPPPLFISITPPSSQSDSSFTKHFVSIVGLHRSVLSLISFFEPSIRVSPFWHSILTVRAHPINQSVASHIYLSIFSLLL